MRIRKTIMVLAISTALTGSLAAQSFDGVAELGPEAAPATELYADGMLVEAPKGVDLQVMNVRVYNADTGELVFSTQSTGEPVSLFTDSDLPDGKYKFEAVSVVYQPTAESLQDEEADHLQAHRSFGQFTVSGGTLTNDNPMPDPADAAFDLSSNLLPLLDKVAGALSGEAVAFTISEASPDITFDDTSSTAADWFIFAQSESNELFQVVRGFSIPFQSANGIPAGIYYEVEANGDMNLGSNMYIEDSTGDVGIGTINPGETLELSDVTPEIRFRDENDSSIADIAFSADGMSITGATSFSMGVGDGNPISFTSGDLRLGGAFAPSDLQVLGRIAVGSDGVLLPVPTARLDIIAGNPDLRFTNTSSGNDDTQTLVFSNNFLRIQGTNGQDLGKMHTLAPVGTFTTDSRGRTGYGTANPGASFNVKYRAAHGSVPVLLAQDNTNAEILRVNVNGNATLAGTLTQNSDRNDKTAIVPVDAQSILTQVAQLPINQWQYKDDVGVNHIGPMAQDFKAAFGLGDTDKGIATVDSSGVALAAIKALAEENGQLKAAHRQLLSAYHSQQDELAQLKADRERLATLEAVVAELTEQQAQPLLTSTR